MKTPIRFLFTLLFAAIVAVQGVHAATFNVTNTGDNGGTNPAPNAGTGTLRQAIVDANANAGVADTINFSPSVTGTISLLAALPILADNVTIHGPGANVLTVQRDPAAATLFRIFTTTSGKTITLSGLTITKGHSPGNLCGGILNDRATLTIESCTVSDNSSAEAGGILNDGNSGSATMTINNSTISGNQGFDTSGIENRGSATLTVTNSTISGNSTGDFGAIGNHAFNGTATLTVKNSTFSGNTASLNLEAGIYNGPSATTTIGNTIFKAGALGANIFNEGGTVTSLGYNITSDGGVTSPNPGATPIVTPLNGTADQNSTDPMLGPLQDNGGPTFTHVLLVGSPAIDKGKNLTAATTDQRGTGFSRTFDYSNIANASGGDGTDIGALETNILVVNKTADTDDGVCNATDCTLREAINAANSSGGAAIIQFDIPTSDPGYDPPNDRYTITLGTALANLNSNISIDGLGAKRLTVKRDPAASAFRIVTINSGKTVTISDVTITNGLANGIFPDDEGGAIYNQGTLTVVSNCTISGNSASWGGGIVNESSGLVAGPTLIINNSAISDNSATFDGGGIFNNGSGNGGSSIPKLTINNSTVSGNSATGGRGGGIYNRGGGGASGGSAILTINSSTFSGNSAAFDGANIHNNDFGAKTTISSTILKTASGANITNFSGGIITSLGYNLSSDNAVAFLNQSTDQNSTDPMLDPNGPQDNGGPTLTIALLCGSPAIDKGKNLAGLTTDQRGAGFARTFDDPDVNNASAGDGTDIGAFEVQTSCNRPPTAMNDGYSTDEDTPLSVPAPGVLGNDSDPDNGDTITAVLVGFPAHGTLTPNADGSFVYVPASNYNGGDSFTYKAVDSHNAESNVATVNITINAVNDPPAIAGGAVSRAQNGGSSNSQIATVSDVDNSAGSLTVSVQSVPTGITVTNLVNSNGTITADVAAGCNAAVGPNTVVLQVSDGQATGNGNLTVNVTANTTPPVITLKPAAVLPVPDHNYRTFSIAQMVQSATDDCGGNVINNVVIEKATSDEVEDSPNSGDGSTRKDIVIAANCKSVQLRAERDATLNGRVYLVTLRVSDSSGNIVRATYKVSVPIGDRPVADSGVHYTVNGNNCH